MPSMSVPRVSIGLPVYNGENYLEAAVESILSQEFGDFELILSDNGSDDATQAICQRFAEADGRVRYYRSNTNRGAAWNYNHTFELARGDFFKWQAHDDLCLPGFLGSCLEVFDSAPSSVVLVYPKTEIIDADGNALAQHVAETIDTRDENPHIRLAKVLKNLNMACAVFGLIRASALRQTRLIGRFIASDYVLLAELAMLGELREVPQTLFVRRVHPRISTYASRSPTELLQWFDPSQRWHRRWVSPMMWLGAEYLRSARRIPLGRVERVRCYLTGTRVWYAREFRNLAGRYKARLLQAMSAGKF
jgi:glycosyltransferase involved in cell wall biosynthesis